MATTDVPEEPSQGQSLFTVLVALVANGLLAIAKSAAAALTGSAAMVAEAAHSWADTGNEVFLVIAERSGSRPRDEKHPRGYGRATYAWSMVAAFGLFTAGAVVSIWHGVTELAAESADEASYTVNYVVLGLAFVLEGSSFLQASRQVHGASRRFGMHPLRYVARTSNPTLRAVFFEDFSALLGILIAAAGIGLHQLTGNSIYDALGSIAIGLLLAFVAVFLIRRNMDYLLGEGPTADTRSRVIAGILEHPQVERLTYLHLEYVGPQRLFVVAAVDLVGDDTEDHLALRLRAVEADIERHPLIEDAVLTVAPPDEASLTP
ncbi:cation diffusion facilitator family transporter [Nocardioides sp. YIM 152315]|uniref:cation diffusion facilitator family transporter n=1 Tax=Nocardioides sp. YIM 152315 TaxID=3031760 RepID=UPI0023DA1D7B|nr:cation diffusion facilitator family transporter [Nocardioides sp. YIM 152315]MDF1604256.1 cation diffusion facilitator family transporter [Nocardioides sp. YIM 152315]